MKKNLGVYPHYLWAHFCDQCGLMIGKLVQHDPIAWVEGKAITLSFENEFAEHGYAKEKYKFCSRQCLIDWIDQDSNYVPVPDQRNE